MIKLPSPKLKGQISVEEAIKNRRTRREYSKDPLSIEEISQLLWAAQGITDEKRNYRATPSAGALYPLEIYIILGKNSIKSGQKENEKQKSENKFQDSDFLKEGLYQYIPQSHSLEKLLADDLRKKLVPALYGQNFASEAPVIIIISAIYERTTIKYGEPGIRYVHIEVGHSAQNIMLQAESLGISVGLIGAGNWVEVAKVLKLPQNNIPIYCMPVGKKKQI